MTGAPAPMIDRAMGDVLEAVGRETSQLHLTAERLQTMAGQLIDRARLTTDDPLIEEAQALDALAQKLDALTRFLARLSQDAPEAWRLDIGPAVQPVFLADLANRLAAQHTTTEDVFSPTGDLEMF